MFDSFAATSTAFSANDKKKEIMTTPIVVNEEEMNSLLRSWSYLCEDTIDLTFQSVLYVDTNNNNNKKEEENTDLYREAMFHCRQGFLQSLHSLTPAPSLSSPSHDMRQCLAHLRLSLSFVPFPHKRMLQSLQERLHTLEQFSIEWETFFISSSHTNEPNPKKSQQRRQQRIEMWRQETLRLENSAFPQTQRFVAWMQTLQEEHLALEQKQTDLVVEDHQRRLQRWTSPFVQVAEYMVDGLMGFIFRKTGWIVFVGLFLWFLVRWLVRFLVVRCCCFLFVGNKEKTRMISQ